MLKLIYLSNGQQAYLVETLPNGKFLVDPIFTYEDHEGNLFDAEAHAYIIADTVFLKPPIAKISDEVKELQNKLAATNQKLSCVQKEVSETEFQLRKSKQEGADLDKWRVDLSRFKTCKSISFFLEGDLLPVTTMKPKYSSDSFSLTFKIDINKGEETQYVTRYYSGGYDNGSRDKIDTCIGFIFDATREELDTLIMQRINNADFGSYTNLQYLQNIPTEYANEAMNKRIDELEAYYNNNAKTSIEKQIADLKERLKAIS